MLFCVLFLLLFCLQFLQAYRPLQPGGNSIAANKMSSSNIDSPIV